MSHIHDVYNTDERFEINPSKRTITQRSGKTRLIRGDHNSECYAFEIPRYVDGHDMSKCDSVRIHYVNTASNGSGEAKGPYDVRDLMVDKNNENFVVFSWLLSRNTTKYAGTLNFSIVFRCLSNSIVDYEWNTDIFKGITVSDRIDNDGNEIVEDYVDVLEQWREELFNGNSDSDSGLPEGDGPNMQLVTDPDGNVKWEERVGYKDWDYVEENDIPVGIYSQGYGSLPFELFPVKGEEYTVTWDGTPYNCPATIITIDDENVTIIGSTTFFGGTVAPDIPVGICCRSGIATVYSDQSGEHTIGVSGYVMNPVKIPREYIDWNPVVGVIDSSWYNYRYLNEARGASIAEIRRAAKEKNKDIVIRLDLDNWQGTMRYLGLIDVSEDGETYFPALVFSTIKTNNASINIADETINGTMELEYWYTPLEPTEGPPANAFVNLQFGKIDLKDATDKSESEQPLNSIPMVDKVTGKTYALEVLNGSLTMSEVTE